MMEIQVETTTTHYIKLTKGDLIGIINQSEVLESPLQYDAEVYVKIPSGGDYGGMPLELDNNVVINIKVTELSKE